MPKRTRILVALALLACSTLLISGPLDEATLTERLFSSALLLDVAVLVAFASLRVAFAMILSSVLFGGVLISSAIKFHYLTTPMLAPDLIYFVNRDLVEVAAHYGSILVALVAGAIVIPGILIVAWRLDRPLLLVRALPLQRRTAQALGVGASAALLLAIASPEGPFWEVFDKGMWQTMNDKSYITDFFTSFYQTQIVIPASAPDVDRSISWSQPPNQNPVACYTSSCASSRLGKSAQSYPDIVAILEESTFDPSMLRECTLPLCKRKMFEPDGRTRAHGLLTVHTWGGGTWTSEFALMAGMNHTSFGNAGLYAPYNLAPRIASSLPKSLKAAGYRAIAIYPMSGNFINARNAYKAYGFDAFYDGEDYGLSWESSDGDLMQVFDQIYAQEKRAIGKQPLFVMMLTLRQHGPHMDPLETLPVPYNRPLFPGKFPPPKLDEWLNLNLANYLYRLGGSDNAIAHIERKLLDSETPALLFHFGDHQPSFDGAIRELDKIVPRTVDDANYVSYYMLKTNYKPALYGDYPLLDLSFAAALILDMANVKKDAFFQANALLRERCQARYLDCPNRRLLDSYHDFIFHQLQAVHE